MTTKRTIITLAITLIASLSLFATGKQESPSPKVTVTKVSADQALALIKDQGAILVDVRTQGEYDEGHIKGAIVIPNETIGSTAIAALPDKNVPVIVYCRSGRRSADAANKLLSLGYTKVYDLGGIQSWPYEVVR